MAFNFFADYEAPARSNNSALNQLSADYEQQKKFFLTRKKETVDVIDMLADRIDAEMTFAIRLDRIGSEQYLKSFQVGLLADAVQSYK